MTTDNTGPRIDYRKVAPKAIEALWTVERYARESSVELRLLELVKLRASMLNGCAYCVDMHSKDARAHGESEQRLYALSVWREAPFFTPRERAALTWTEEVTMVSANHVPDGVYRLAREYFEEGELVDLTMAIIAINAWNRLAIAFRAVAGTYEPAKHSAESEGFHDSAKARI
jgi:AhpD family alkylhydroperoxidase